MSVGSRLIEERKRLRLSQGDFARKADVSISTQKRYEINEREPGVGYLEGIRKLGVDVTYILTGLRRGGNSVGIDFEALGEFGLAVVKYLDIDPGDLKIVISNAERAVRQQFKDLDAADAATWFAAYRESFFVHASDLLRRKIASYIIPGVEIDSGMLAKVIEAAETAMEAKGKKLSQEKKARLIAMLYRVSNLSGKVETNLIEDIFTIGGK